MSAFHEQIAWQWPTLNQMLDAASCQHALKHVTTPLLCINTLDDPLCHPNFLPFESFARNDTIALALTARGGHHSFVGNWFGLNYGERVALQFLESALAEPQASQPPVRRSRSKSWSSGSCLLLLELVNNLSGRGWVPAYRREYVIVWWLWREKDTSRPNRIGEILFAEVPNAGR